MRFLACCLTLIALSSPTPLAAQAEKRTCLDSQRVRNWIVIDEETLLLDAGQKKYRVTLLNSCFNLGISPTLQFKGDPITGRICSGSFDAIRVQREQCRISKITEIDKQTFNDAQNKKKLSLKVKKSAANAKQTPENK
ncbi:MAG: DUF6491 family protein [Arenimonas sp.]